MEKSARFFLWFFLSFLWSAAGLYMKELLARYSLFSCGRHGCMKARLITQGQIQHGVISLLRFTFAPIIVALTREYHSTAFLIIRKGEPIRSLRFEEILMRILRYINELYLGVYFVVQFTVFAPDTAVHKRLFGTIRTRGFQENPHR